MSHPKVQPVYLSKIVAKIKTKQEVGKLLGISPTHVSKNLNPEEGCRLVVELAAEALYKDRYAADKPVLAIIEHDETNMKLIEGIVAQTGGYFSPIGKPSI